MDVSFLVFSGCLAFLLIGPADVSHGWFTPIHRRLCSLLVKLPVRVLLYVELIVYALVRSGIAWLEHVYADNKDMKRKLNESNTYQQWFRRAKKLDRIEGRDVWQQQRRVGKSIHHNWEVLLSCI